MQEVLSVTYVQCPLFVCFCSMPDWIWTSDYSFWNFRQWETSQHAVSANESRYTKALPGSFRLRICIICGETVGQTNSLTHRHTDAQLYIIVQICSGFAVSRQMAPHNTLAEVLWSCKVVGRPMLISRLLVSGFKWHGDDWMQITLLTRLQLKRTSAIH